MFLNLCDVIEQSLLVTNITSPDLDTVTNISNLVILPDVNIMMYILRVVDLFKVYITTTFTYLCWGLINMFFSDRWTARWGPSRQLLSDRWWYGRFPPCWFWSRHVPQGWFHRPHESPDSHGDTPAPIDFDHHLAVRLVL
jgi:hypothetical protein